MSEAAPADAPAVAAESAGRAAVAVIETDAFCEGCSFNLRTQKVWRDERLDIAVCRCPECGRHHAAGMRTTAGSAWARRAALGGLLVWLAIQVCFVIALFFSFFGVAAAASEGLLSRDHMLRDGRVVEVRGTGTGTYEFALGPNEPFNLSVNDVVYGRRLAPWLLGQPTLERDEYRFATPIEALMLAVLFSTLTIIAGILLGSMSWFWRRGRRWLWLLLPVVSTAFVATLIAQETRRGRVYTGVSYAEDRIELMLMIAVGAALVVVLAIGIAISMPMARFFVSIFIPPKARQLFAFLWHRDGRTIPRDEALA